MDKFKSLINSINTLIDSKLKNLKFDYTFSAIIKTDNGNGNYHNNI